VTSRGEGVSFPLGGDDGKKGGARVKRSGYGKFQENEYDQENQNEPNAAGRSRKVVKKRYWMLGGLNHRENESESAIAIGGVKSADKTVKSEHEEKWMFVNMDKIPSDEEKKGRKIMMLKGGRGHRGTLRVRRFFLPEKNQAGHSQRWSQRRLFRLIKKKAMILETSRVPRVKGLV